MKFKTKALSLRADLFRVTYNGGTAENNLSDFISRIMIILWNIISCCWVGQKQNNTNIRIRESMEVLSRYSEILRQRCVFLFFFFCLFLSLNTISTGRLAPYTTAVELLCVNKFRPFSVHWENDYFYCFPFNFLQ